ncbi:glycerophosphoryl diester phosphodiesterase [Nocardioides thalensis]|uniref:glycerophosphodiester phosphodiesterase n=1 Tax=Nocardioides thalensis TaxID=1914755 RepID=A0A853C0U6_9ACTN|nr:glycerophosphodiester phosphodiesterase [Nocardioides thalensis]NYJ00352.1 glycerophosphoryl diester phosphodiesterase [Nocardioides thalensis]
MTRSISPYRRALVAATALSAVAVAPGLAPASADPGTPASIPVEQLEEPLVFAHRGASGYRPEHTLAAYELGVEQGADYIEPDLVSTKDGVLVARHENEISGTTDVEAHPEFADRKKTKTIDGRQFTGWFTEDFTLAELKTLRAEERIPADRPQNTQYNGLYEVPTLEEVLTLVDELEAETGRTIGVAPELKHSTYFDSIGLSMEEPLVETLAEFDLDEADSAVAIQSFEVTNLKDLNGMTDAPLVQLLDGSGGPADLAGSGVTYESMLTKKGIKRISKYADWLSPYKLWVIPRTATGELGEPTGVVATAHKAGLPVVIWTMRAENKNLPTECRVGADPIAIGDLACEVHAYLDAGVDAFFTDHPDLGVAARDAF